MPPISEFRLCTLHEDLAQLLSTEYVFNYIAKCLDLHDIAWSTADLDLTLYHIFYGIQVYIPCLFGIGCKRSLVLEMEVRVSVYRIIIIIICPDIAIDELMGRKAIFNQPTKWTQNSNLHHQLIKVKLNVLIWHVPTILVLKTINDCINDSTTIYILKHHTEHWLL